MEQGSRRDLIVLAAAIALAAAVGLVVELSIRDAEWPVRARSAVAPTESVEAKKLLPEKKLKSRVLEAAIEVNRILEPELDEAALRKALDELVEKARCELKGATADQDKASALNRVLLADREVTYLSNIRWRDSSLAAALLRRRGNCLATTTLYVVVGKMLDLPIHAVIVPNHALARFEGEEPINIETTAAGAHTPDSALRYRFDFGDGEAKDFGYGKSLSEEEFAASLLVHAAHHLDSANRTAEALALVERAQALWPDSLNLGFARAGMLYGMSGRRREALDFYRKVARGNGGYSRSARASALVVLASHAHSLGRQDEALRYLRLAYSLAPRSTQVGILSLMSSCYRTERDFSAAALAQELALLLRPEADALGGLAIMYKNASRLEDAIRVLRASLLLNPESWNTRLILAGYLIRAGHEDEGWKMLATVKEPRVDKQLYHTNLAWFYGSVGKKKELLEHLGKALSLSKTPHILNYIRTEVDFDRYRDDPDFKALVEKHRRRLLGEKGAGGAGSGENK